VIREKSVKKKRVGAPKKKRIGQIVQKDPQKGAGFGWGKEGRLKGEKVEGGAAIKERQVRPAKKKKTQEYL